MNHYDIIIIGGGIAGLYIADLLCRDHKILLLEQNSKFGGRISTITQEINGEQYNYESGAGRISENHTRLLELIKRYRLKSKLLESKSNKLHILGPNTYNDLVEDKNANSELYLIDKHERLDINFLIDTVIKRSKKYERYQLINMSFYNLIQLELSSDASAFILDAFGYISELLDMTAFDGVRLFRKDFKLDNKFFVLSGGLGQIVNNMVKKLHKHANVTLKTKHLVTGYSEKNNIYTVYSENIFKEILFTSKRLILALPRNGLRSISGLHNTPKLMRNIYSVKPHPLCRVYAIYPKNKKTGKVWFDGMPKITTDNDIQYIIPIDYNTGLIMISYSDDIYADYWQKVTQTNRLKEKIKKNLNRLFPSKSIPDPLYLQSHYWSEGCHFFTPGNDSIKISKEMLKPIKNKEIYICGEAYSLHQAWIEGALQTAEDVFKIINQQSGGLDPSKLPIISLEDLKKHNTRKSAWMAIEGFVLDVTDFIDKHPGGSIILKGLGKDVTDIWYDFGHSPKIIKKYFPQYTIGILEKKT